MTVEPPGVRTRDTDREETDARVIERSRDEPELFAVLFDRYADAVHRYAARRLGPEAAEDLMAETFTTAFQRRHTYDLSRGDARPWLFGIATNLVSRHRRSQARRFPNQKDAKGRTGVAITYDDPMIPSGQGGYGGFFIFEPRTHRFLGFCDERSSGDGANMKRYVQLSYLDSWAVVDKVKQRP